VVQRNPGGLIRIDTSLGVDGEPLDVDVGAVEVCSQPTSMVIYDDGDNEYGLVTCYRSGEVFIVDLAALTVVGLSRAGIGPDAMAVDVAREVVYVANSLDATISIIDMGRTSPSRFTEIGRIGLQEPYTQ
jgi:DNA-binding beta-propeller fold protein YncE